MGPNSLDYIAATLADSSVFIPEIVTPSFGAKVSIKKLILFISANSSKKFTLSQVRESVGIYLDLDQYK